MSRGNLKYRLRGWFTSVRAWLSGLSFRTGVCVAVACIMFYALAFLCLALPFSYALRIGLWALFYGLAKTAQYSALLILGKAGVQKLKRLFKKIRA